MKAPELIEKYMTTGKLDESVSKSYSSLTGGS